MKIKLLIFIFYLVIGSLNGQSLSTDENKQRLERCGNFGDHTSMSTNLTFDTYFDDKRRIMLVNEKYVEKTSKSGNPLIKGKEKLIIVGVSTKENGKFFAVRWISQKICDSTGICPQPPTPAVAPPTTEAPTTVPTTPPTTEAPTTDKVKESTTESENITTPTITDPSTTKESPSPEPTMEPIPVIDLDQEYKEFKEREAEDDKGDWDE